MAQTVTNNNMPEHPIRDIDVLAIIAHHMPVSHEDKVSYIMERMGMVDPRYVNTLTCTLALGDMRHRYMDGRGPVLEPDLMHSMSPWAATRLYRAVKTGKIKTDYTKKEWKNVFRILPACRDCM